MEESDLAKIKIVNVVGGDAMRRYNDVKETHDDGDRTDTTNCSIHFAVSVLTMPILLENIQFWSMSANMCYNKQ